MERAFRPERLDVADPAPRPLPLWAWIVAAALIIALAIGGFRLKPADADLAAWWPAVGAAVWLVLRAGLDRRWAALAVVLVAMIVGNTIAGRDIPMTVTLGLANTAEALLVSVMLHRNSRFFRMRTARDALRFITATGLGAAFAGVFAATLVTATTGTPLGFGYLDTVLHVTASHMAATLLIGAFAVLPPRFAGEASTPEMVLQTGVLAFTLAFVFVPGMSLPLSFLPFAFTVWAAFRFPVRFALAQSLLTSVTVLVCTLMGGGPFASGGLPMWSLALVVELYMIVLSVITIMLIAARYEARQAARTALSVSQLITGGFVASRVGLIIAEENAGALTVLWANRAAVTAIDAELRPDGAWSGPLARHAMVSIAEGVETMHEDRASGTTISLVAGRIPGDPTRFSAQLVDVGATIRMAQARHDAEVERAAARSTLVDLERQRDDFVATTSHELRTPVTSIAGYAELLAESQTLTPSEQAWVRIIVRNAARLTTLVEDLLTLGRSGVAVSQTPVLNLRDLAGEVVDIHRPMADARRIRLELDVDADAAVHCVTDDATRALGNLVSNAVKFTPPGGTVRIRSDVHDGRIALTVSDTGPGMTPETLAQAFDRFYRGHDAVQANTPGTGLGLAIAAQLAERNGGAIRLACPPGGGLEATVAFADAAPAPKVLVDPS